MSQPQNNNTFPKSNPPTTSLQALLHPKILTYKTIITAFLTDLYTDIFQRSNRIVNTYTFQELTQLPMIINEKLYLSLTNHAKCFITLPQFSNGIYTLLYDDLDNKLLNTFKIYDFNNDTIIHKNDVYLILSHFHLIENPSTTLHVLEDIINNFFGENDEMSFNTYETHIYNTNCDIALLLVVFITNYLILYRKEEMKLFKKLYMKSNKYHPSCSNEELKYNVDIDKYTYTHELIEYVNKLHLKERPDPRIHSNNNNNSCSSNNNIDLDNSDDSIIISDSEEEKDLNDLNTFEKDMNSIFNRINGDSFKLQKTLCPSRSFTIKSFTSEQEQNNSSKKLRHVATVDLAHSKTSNDLMYFSGLINSINNKNTLNKSSQKNANVNVLTVHHNLLNSSCQDDSALSNNQNQNRTSSSFSKQQPQQSSLQSNTILPNGNTTTPDIVLPSSSTATLSHTLPESVLITESKKANNFQLLKSITSYSPLLNGRKANSTSKRPISFGVGSLNENCKSPIIFVYKCEDDITTEIKMKLILVNKYIFIFKKEEKTNYFAFKRFFPIVSIFPSLMRMNKKITKINFHSSVHNYVTTRTYIGENNNADIERFINEMNKRNGYTSISNDYELQNEIGRGKFGHVLLAKYIKGDKRDKHVYAVKIIKKNPACEEEYKINRWESSIFSMLVNITHPNVIRCYNKYETIDRILFVYEYIEGHDLKTFIKKSYDLNRKVNMIALSLQIIEGICYIHKLGIIHRDIKTTNILVDIVHDNTIKIIDFGLSRVLGHVEFSLDPYGSLCFKAPEILKSIPYSFKVDVWAIGVTLYYLVFKQLPFEKGSKNEIKKSILSEPIVFPINNLRFEGNKGNNFVMNIIKDCLERDIDKRPYSAELFYKHLDKAKRESIYTTNNTNTTD